MKSILKNNVTKFKNKMLDLADFILSNPTAIGGIIGIIITIAAIVGYILNITDIVSATTITRPLVILRLVGVFMPPLGAILGYF